MWSSEPKPQDSYQQTSKNISYIHRESQSWFLFVEFTTLQIFPSIQSSSIESFFHPNLDFRSNGHPWSWVGPKVTNPDPSSSKYSLENNLPQCINPITVIDNSNKEPSSLTTHQASTSNSNTTWHPSYLSWFYLFCNCNCNYIVLLPFF